MPGAPTPPGPGYARNMSAARLLIVLLLAGCAPKPVAPAAAGARAGSTSPAPTTREALTNELVIEGPLKSRLSTSPAELVVFYGSEHKGSLETCGCPKRPRGSFSRLDAYVDASRAANPGVPAIVVNAGYWLQDAMGFDGQLRPDVTVGNRYMVEGVRALGWDALNVAYTDVAGLSTLPSDDGPPLPLVSANVEGPGINRWVVVNRGGLRVGITGITAQGATLSDLPGYTIKPPADAKPVLAALAAEADVIVLLAYQATEVARDLAAENPAIDVVVDAALHRESADAFYVDRAAWVLSHFQTMRLGELRLRLSDGAVTGGVSRSIDLDPELPDDPALLALTKRARVELDAAQQALYGP